MDKKLRFSYDELSDILYIHLGEPRPAISDEIEEDFFVQRDRENGKVVGFMLMNFKNHFLKEKGFEIPVEWVSDPA